MVDITVPVSLASPYGTGNTQGFNLGSFPVIYSITTSFGGTTSSGNFAFRRDTIILHGVNFTGVYSVIFGKQVRSTIDVPQFTIPILLGRWFSGPAAAEFNVISDTTMTVSVPDMTPLSETIFTNIAITKLIGPSGLPGSTIWQNFTVLSGIPAWNPASVSGAGVTLSNNNLTVTSPGSPPAQNVNFGVTIDPLLAQSSGKFYFEITLTAQALGGAENVFGVCNTTVTYQDLSILGTGGVRVQTFAATNIFCNGVDTNDNIGVIQVNDTIGCAIDCDNKLTWWKPVAGSGLGTNWNGVPSADPTTATGGISIASISGPVLPYVAFQFSTAGDAMTANFGATAYSGTVPLEDFQGVLIPFANWPAKP